MTRRIVTGHRGGMACFIDLEGPEICTSEHAAGYEVAKVWATPPSPMIERAPSDPVPVLETVVPPIGGTVLLRVTFPPEAVFADIRDWAAAGAEQARFLPGLAERFESENPGMHRTPTIDYAILLQGELWLELDDGASRQLLAGDIVVQIGTRHAWRNRSEVPATIIFILIGAENT